MDEGKVQLPTKDLGINGNLDFRDYNIFNYYSTRTIVQIAFLLLAFCVGVPTNILSLAVSLKRQRHVLKRFHILQIHRSIADLLFLLIYIPTQLFHEIDTVTWESGPVTCKIFKFARNFAFQASSNVIVAIAIDRYKGLRGLTAGDGWTTRDLNKLVAGAWAIAALTSIPQFGIAVLRNIKKKFACTYVWVPKNVTEAQLAKYLYQMPIEEKMFTLQHVLVQFWIPFVSVFVLYYKIWMILQRRTGGVNSGSSKNSILLRVLGRRSKTTDISLVEQRSINRSKYSIVNGKLLEQSTAGAQSTEPEQALEDDNEPGIRNTEVTMQISAGDRTKWRGFMAANTAMRRSMIITLVYVVLWLPYSSLCFWQMVDRVSYVKHLNVGALYTLIVLNSAMNPWLYSLTPCGSTN